MLVAYDSGIEKSARVAAGARPFILEVNSMRTARGHNSRAFRCASIGLNHDAALPGNWHSDSEARG